MGETELRALSVLAVAVVADFEVDLGMSGQAESVRIVTDYGDEISCWAGETERNGGGGRVRVHSRAMSSRVRTARSRASTSRQR